MTGRVSQLTRPVAIPSPGIATRADRGHARGMPELSTDLIVAAPAERVWDVIGRRFDHIGDWSTAILASPAIPTPLTRPPAASAPASSMAAAGANAPVAGRVCQTGIRLVGEITETLIAYDDANRTLTYQAAG